MMKYPENCSKCHEHPAQFQCNICGNRICDQCDVACSLCDFTICNDPKCSLFVFNRLFILKQPCPQCKRGTMEIRGRTLDSNKIAQNRADIRNKDVLFIDGADEYWMLADHGFMSRDHLDGTFVGGDGQSQVYLYDYPFVPHGHVHPTAIQLDNHGGQPWFLFLPIQDGTTPSPIKYSPGRPNFTNDVKLSQHHLAIASGNSAAYLVDRNSKEILHTVEGMKAMVRVAVNQRYFACSGRDGSAVYDIKHQETLYYNQSLLDYGEIDIQFINTHYLVGVNLEGEVVQMHVPDWTETLRILPSKKVLTEPQRHFPHRLGLSERYVAYRVSDATFQIFDLKNPHDEILIPCPQPELPYIDYAINNRFFAASNSDGFVYIWDHTTQEMRYQLKAKSYEFPALLFADQDLIVDGGVIQIWKNLLK